MEMKKSSLEERLKDSIAEGRQRVRDMRDDVEGLTLAEERDVASEVAFVDANGYVVYIYDKLQALKRQGKIDYAHEKTWEQIIAEAPDDAEFKKGQPWN